MKGDKEIILGRKELLKVLREICAHLTLGLKEHGKHRLMCSQY
jgi:hypothetical protein